MKIHTVERPGYDHWAKFIHTQVTVLFPKFSPAPELSTVGRVQAALEGPLTSRKERDALCQLLANIKEDRSTGDLRLTSRA